MCGSMEIDGYAFCLGLKSLKLSYTDSPELQTLPSVIYLIEQAGLRSKYTTDSPERFSLNIRCLAELIDMFHTRKATDVRDKVYAMLGMSSDDPGKAGLRPDYEAPWKDLFQRLVRFVLGESVSVVTSDNSQRAVIRSKGCIVGQVSSVSKYRQSLEIISKHEDWYPRCKKKCTLRASAKSIRVHDIVCFLQGASKPTIIRQCKDHFVIIVIAATPLNDSKCFELSKSYESNAYFFPRDLLLVWDWEKTLGESQGQEEYEALAENIGALEHSNATFGDRLDKGMRIWNLILVLGDVGEYKKAEEMLREAIAIVITEKHLYTLKGHHNITPLLWAPGSEQFRRLSELPAKDGIDPDPRDSQFSRTLLSYAAENGNEAIVKLLLEIGINADSRDDKFKTPLWWAARNGHKAIVKLLLETGKVEADSKDNSRETPLWWAAQNGHEAVVKLLLDTGKVKADLENFHETPLWWAARNGHEAVVKLLLETGKVEADSKVIDGRTPLWWAAQNGNEAIVKLLLETGKVEADSKDFNGTTPLWWAARNGHEAIVKLLLETGKVEADSKDIKGRTPLWWAARNKHEAVIKLLRRG